PSTARGIFAFGEHREHDDSTVERVHGRSDPRGTRSGDGREVGWSGESAGRRGNVEGFDGQREPDGQQFDWPGAQHRGSGHGGGQRRFVAQDHGGRTRRDSPVKGSDQLDGGSVALVRFRSDARGARGWNRWKAWRPGGGSRSGRDVEGPDGFGQRDGRKPDGASAQHCGGNYGGGARRLVAQNNGGREGRNP